MPTANEALRDAFIRHQIYLLRYSAFLRKVVTDRLDKTEPEMSNFITERLRDSQGLRSAADVAKLNKLLGSIDDQRRAAWDAATEDLQDQMSDLAKKEPMFAKGLFMASSKVVLDMVLPPDARLIAIATNNPFEGAILKDWAASMQDADIRRIHAAIQHGMITGETTPQIVRRVMGTEALKGTDGVTEVTRRQVMSIVRTAVQHVSNGARDEFFQANADIIEAELFVATLDSRTTAQCRALDGKRYEVGKGPRPPLHFACRSLRIAAMSDVQAGNRPAKASTRRMILKDFTEENDLPFTGDRDALPRGWKGKFDEYERKAIRKLTGPIPASTTYDQWLRLQSPAFQDEILGAAKAKLFREGLTLDKYVAANGTELTLEQLSKKYADIFKRAGVTL